MKICDPFFLKKGLAICTGVIFCLSAGAQCTNNLGTSSYDTLLSGPGYGTYQLSVPQWSPDSGLLVSVKLSVIVSVQYGFTLKNGDDTVGSYSLTVGRLDQITGAALPADYYNIKEKSLGTFILNPGASISTSPFPFLTNYVNTDSLASNLTPFMGRGMLHFTYSPSTYTTMHTSSSYGYRATASDNMHFSLSYLYCKSGGTLATGLTRWDAVLKDGNAVQLDWAVAGEAPGRRYVVQRSMDGRNFNEVGVVEAGGGNAGGGNEAQVDGAGGDGGGNGGAASGNNGATGAASYTYTDILPSGSELEAGGHWYYRLLLTDETGSSYSPVKEVSVNNLNRAGFSIYPSPATDHIELVMGTTQGGGQGAGWRVEVLAADGSLVQRCSPFYGSRVRVDFTKKLSAGVYFVRVTDLAGHKNAVLSFLISSW